MSETDFTITSLSWSNFNEHKKWKSNSEKVIINRSNKSFTNYFFLRNPEDDDKAYCIICKWNLTRTNKKPYPYSQKRGITTNLTNHLWNKHDIVSYNFGKINIVYIYNLFYNNK